MIRQITNCGCEPDADAMRIIFDTRANPNVTLARPRADILATTSKKIRRHKNDFLIPDSKMLHTDDSINTRYYNFLEFVTFS